MNGQADFIEKFNDKLIVLLVEETKGPGKNH
jgi:hypothetical protein